MKIIGLAGGSGTGKTTIAKHLEARGGGHLDADQIGHELLEFDPGVRSKVRRYFGPDVFEPDGTVNRKTLGQLVFEDRELLKVLSSILHPRIIDTCLQKVDEMSRAGLPFLVIDAALLLEVKMPLPVEHTIAVRCDKEEQVRRLLAKGGVSEADIRARLKSQERMEDYFVEADVVLDTDGELSEVLARVDKLVDEFLER
jgi:dephospho-CoA kinase